MHDCDDGWLAGQHVRLRVFFDGRLFEAHPLTILTAPPQTSCVSTRTLTLAARVKGDWTRSLNAYTHEEQARLSLGNEKQTNAGVPVQVMFDGAYGGCSIDLGDYESILLVAGGSGATFTLGLLDDIVGRCTKLNRPRNERTKRIEFVWCIRSFACVDWFAGVLNELATAVAASPDLDLHVSIYVTCLCNPEAVPPIPNCDVSVYRPSVATLLRELVSPPPDVAEAVLSSGKLTKVVSQDSDGDLEDERKSAKVKLNWVGLGGGVGVCASGPESLILETQNAVARLGAMRGVSLGGIGLHTELFAV